MSRRKWITAGLAGAALLAGAAASGRAQAPVGAPPAAATPAAPAAAKPPAVVNGEVVGKAELDDALKQAAGPNPAPLTEDQRRGQAMQVLGMLIDDKLMHQFIAKNAAPAPPAEVSARVAAVEAELKKQNKTLQDFYKESGQTEMTFRADCALAVQWDNYAKSKISDADVEKYYKYNKDFFDRVMVRASHILLRIPPNATDADKAKLKEQLNGLRARSWPISSTSRKRPRSTRSARRRPAAATSATSRASSWWTRPSPRPPSARRSTASARWCRAVTASTSSK